MRSGRAPTQAMGLPSDFRASVPPVRSTTEEPVFGPVPIAGFSPPIHAMKRLKPRAAGLKRRRRDDTLKVGSNHPLVRTLRARLVISGDLPEKDKAIGTFDEGLSAAIRRFQARHGLTQTGGSASSLCEH